MDRKNIKNLVAQLKSGISALESAMGQDRYTDGASFGNPVQEFNDPAADMGGQEDGSKKGAFIAMMKKKHRIEE